MSHLMMAPIAFFGTATAMLTNRTLAKSKYSKKGNINVSPNDGSYSFLWHSHSDPKQAVGRREGHGQGSNLIH